MVKFIKMRLNNDVPEHTKLVCYGPPCCRSMCRRSRRSGSDKCCVAVFGSMMFLAGWTLMLVAGINSKLNTISHPFIGFEWVGNFVISSALFILCLVPRGRQTAADYEPGVVPRLFNEDAVICTGVTYAIVVGAGCIFNTIMVYFEWYAPPEHEITQHARGIFSSPSPSPKPKAIWVPTPSDNVTGTLILMSTCLMMVGAMAAWYYVSPNMDVDEDDTFGREMN